jgi:uncharacterized SAM-binding protein YcdF (DUF218 family)
MFFIKKVISYFLIPPGIFVILFLLIAYLTRKREGFTSKLALLSAILLYALSTEPVKDFLILPLERGYSVPENPSGDVIIVLGGGAYNSGRLMGSSFKRTVAGYLLHKKLGVPVILSGGRSTGLTPESLIMKELMIKLGAEERFLYTDTESRDTLENGLFVKRICESLSCKKVILVTSAFHMKRSLSVFESLGFNVVPYPVDFRYDGRYNIYSYFPKYSVFRDSAAAIREYIGRIYYSILLFL